WNDAALCISSVQFTSGSYIGMEISYLRPESLQFLAAMLLLFICFYCISKRNFSFFIFLSISNAFRFEYSQLLIVQLKSYILCWLPRFSPVCSSFVSFIMDHSKGEDEMDITLLGTEVCPLEMSLWKLRFLRPLGGFICLKRSDSSPSGSSVPGILQARTLEWGVIVTLSDEGHLQCSYLGTDPSLFQAPKVESRELNYDELDKELKELQKVIKNANKSQGVWPLTEREDDLKVSAMVSSNFDSVSQATDAEVGADLVPSVTVKVTLRNRVALQKIKLSIYVQPPLVLTDDQFTFESLAPDMTRTVGFSVYLKGSYLPPELEGNAVVSYSRPTERNPDGIPRVSQCKFRLPLKLVCLPGQPSKTASHKLIIDTNKPPVSLLSLFPGFAKQLEDDQVNVMGFHFLGGSQVTLLASKTSQRYRIQSEQFEDLWLITNELIVRLQEYFEKQGIKDFTCSFSGPVPLQEYFELIDHHFELRINGEKLEELLSERAVQFRAIQRRLLTRFKDKTPAPLQHLDTLLDGTYKQVHPCCCITLFHSFLWLSSIPLYICIISLFISFLKGRTVEKEMASHSMGCHFFLQGVFLTHDSNPRLRSPALAGRFFTISAT
ncbi:hypothetical protein FD755_012449, partial [Muntiacus reevesi]